MRGGEPLSSSTMRSFMVVDALRGRARGRARARWPLLLLPRQALGLGAGASSGGALAASPLSAFARASASSKSAMIVARVGGERASAGSRRRRAGPRRDRAPGRSTSRTRVRDAPRRRRRRDGAASGGRAELARRVRSTRAPPRRRSRSSRRGVHASSHTESVSSRVPFGAVPRRPTSFRSAFGVSETTRNVVRWSSLSGESSATAPVVREGGHAEAHGEGDRLPGGGQVDGVRDARADGLRRRDGGVLAESGQHDHELVAGIGHRPRRRVEPAPDGGRHLLDRARLPLRWPRASTTRLKWSRSMKRTEKVVPAAALATMSWSSAA